LIAYLDSSVLLRVLLGQPDSLAEWRDVETGVASDLAEVECLRTLDRLRLRAGLTDEELARRREAVHDLLDAVERVELSTPVLRRASQPFPTALGTLDALHLATALLYRDETGLDLVMATHDEALARAARASGLKVPGV